MEDKYRKRSKIACVVAILTWLLLAITTRITGCNSPDNWLNESLLGVDFESDENSNSEPIIELTSTAHFPPLWEQGTAVDEQQNILLLGFDGWGSLPGLSDTMMILVVRHETKEIGIISVPRDLWVEIPGIGHGRINKVYRVGSKLAGERGGRQLLNHVIANELGVEIDYTVALDFRAFKKMVNSLGGVVVDVKCPIKDNFIVPYPPGHELLHVKAGKRHMDGKTALRFARSRHGRTDLDRARRGQAVLSAIAKRLKKIDYLTDLPSLWSTFNEHVSTDIGIGDAFRLANLVLEAEPSNFHGIVLREPVIDEWRAPGGKSVLLLNHDEWQKKVDTLFEAPFPGKKIRKACPSINAALKPRKRN